MVSDSDKNNNIMFHKNIILSNLKFFHELKIMMNDM